MAVAVILSTETAVTSCGAIELPSLVAAATPAEVDTSTETAVSGCGAVELPSLLASATAAAAAEVDSSTDPAVSGGDGAICRHTQQ